MLGITEQIAACVAKKIYSLVSWCMLYLAKLLIVLLIWSLVALLQFGMMALEFILGQVVKPKGFPIP